MNNTSAYQTGYQIGVWIGMFMALAIVLAIAAFFVFCLVKAINTKRAGWIAAASLSAIPFLFLVGVFAFALAKNFNKGIQSANEMAEVRSGQPSPLLNAPATPVSGIALPYQISLPALSEWTDTHSRHPYDHLFNYRNAYVGIIAEDVGLGSPEEAVRKIQRSATMRAADVSNSPATDIVIDDHAWKTYDTSATIHGIMIKYRFYVYADKNYTVQILSWTTPKLFDHYAPVFDQVSKSFKLPAE